MKEVIGRMEGRKGEREGIRELVKNKRLKMKIQGQNKEKKGKKGENTHIHKKI